MLTYFPVTVRRAFAAERQGGAANKNVYIRRRALAGRERTASSARFLVALSSNHNGRGGHMMGSLADADFYSIKHYPRCVGDLGSYRERITRSKFDLLSSAIDLRPELKLLDIGCDAGVLLRMFESLGLECYGIDVSADAVARAKHRRVLRASVNALPFRDSRFDICISSHLIEHLERPEVLVRGAAAVLNPGGILALLYPWEIFRGMTIVPDLVLARQLPLPSRLRRIHRHLITPEKVRCYAREFGLREERQGVFWGFPYIVPQYFSILRKPQ